MDGLEPASVLGPGGAIARRLPNYESRPEQLKMAEAVARAIDGNHHLMVEAGTGVGKSFAYLVPAILAAAESGRKVVVSTHTISLQEQLIEKDIPFLRAVMPHEFSAVLVKGRSNYISLRRLDATVTRAAATFEKVSDFEQLEQIRVWSGKTTDGSGSDLPFRPARGVWATVESDTDNCLSKKCPRYQECFFQEARRRMRTANVLIVNHALLMRDVAARAAGGEVLPEYDLVIVDEAHQLDEVASTHLGLKLSASQVEFMLNRLATERGDKGLLVFHHLDRAARQVERVREASRAFFDRVFEWRRRHGGSNGRLRAPLDWGDTLGEQLERLSNAVGTAADEIEKEEQRIELVAAAVRSGGLAATVRAWQNHEVPDSVYWVDDVEGPRSKVSLACAPLDVGPTLRDALFDAVPTCVLTSATLSVGSPPRFDFYKSRLGLTRCQTLQLGSPFDYPRQVVVHLPRGLPDPSERAGEFESAATDAIRFYLEKTHGKAFVLFTSYRHMEAAARALNPWFVERNITLLSQSDGMPRSKMVEAFKADVDSVIFGADSFWQGVDVPGDALSNVIIVRLPFSVPTHPLLEARLEEIRKSGGNPFHAYQVPEAVIKLKQGFGRLIRSKSDRGIVAILDPRVLSKPYGQTFLNSLPACPRIMDDLDLRPPARPA
jgi:ATP-dependent DNA helicase DinG